MHQRKLRTMNTVATLSPALACTLWCAIATAQSDDGDGGTARVPAGSGNTTVVVNPPAATSTTTVAPWGMMPGGKDDSEGGSYGFDLPGTGSTGTVRGGTQNSFVLSGRPAGIPAFHTVRRGDTLWDLCDLYYDNPYAWPRVWSYNPQIENPHWIYPGDRIRLRTNGMTGNPTNERGAAINRNATVPTGTIFLRDYGYIGSDSDDTWGTLVGSPNDQMLLSDGNDAYIKINDKHEVRIGQELTLYREARKPEAGNSSGRIVHVKGTIKITQWNPKTHTATAKIVESLDVIERGDKVGPVSRRFDMVPPVPNDLDVWAKITGAIHPHELIGQHHVVFIDKGEQDGLKPGNRLFAVVNGDRWSQSVQVGRRNAAARVNYRLRSADVTTSPDTVSGQKFPSEIAGEIRVLRVRKETAICVVTSADFEMEPGQTLWARRGY